MFIQFLHFCESEIYIVYISVYQIFDNQISFLWDSDI